MKKIIIVILIIVAVVIAVFAARSARVPQVAVEVGSSAPSGRFCYRYVQAATPDAPYSVDETVDLTVSDGKVAGTKKGTQAGPDMTNGYEGTLSGTVSGSELDLVFAYTIEGSSNKEQELYTMGQGTLVKHRYPLTDKGDMLVPDTAGQAQDISYRAVSCE